MGRGRPRKTDPDEVLDRSMKVFWEKGFDGTSMNDLVAATGMAKPGLYATFGDKEALYEKALSRYTDNAGARLLADLMRTPGPLDAAVRTFLESVAESVIDDANPSGCFLVNSLIECAKDDGRRKALARSSDADRRAGFVERFRAAREAGDLPPEADAEKLGEFYAALPLTLAVMARAGADAEALSRFIEVAMTALPGDAMPPA